MIDFFYKKSYNLNKWQGGGDLIYLNMEFLDEYKRLDILCRDVFDADDKSGVTAYIDEMDNTPISQKSLVPSWQSDYKNLKRCRWMRNKLAHEIIDYTICDEDDIEWIKDFQRRITNKKDPFGIIHTATLEYKKNLRAQKSSKKTNHTTLQKRTTEKKPTTVGSKIFSFFKRLLKL